MEEQEDQLIETLRLQLNELDMLQSMFPNEIRVDDPSVMADVNDYVERKLKKLPPRIDFVIHLQLDESVKFELACSFPHEYPLTEPEVFVRSQQLGRNEQHEINQDLLNYVTKLEKGEVCVYSIVQWLKDGGLNYISNGKNELQPEMCSATEEKEDEFSRYWIYSHHIYNKMKRRTILDLAKELDVTGFCLPGKPGIICAEGSELNCSEFWDRIKSMQWKKIMCKMKEKVRINDNDCDTNLRRFQTFEEVAFEVRHGPGREYHMDMGEFFQYLEKHQCGYVFKSYFGFDGKVSNHE